MIRTPKNNSWNTIIFKDAPDFDFRAFYKDGNFFYKEEDTGKTIVLNPKDLKLWYPSQGYHIPNAEITVEDINGYHTGKFINNSFSEPLDHTIISEYYKAGETNKLYNLVFNLSCFFKVNLFLPFTKLYLSHIRF